MERGAEPGPGDAEPRIVKRYANRKLYDTRDSQYVTLQQIAAFVREGEDVRIIDNKTKEDLTNLTLAQIIYEEQKKGDGPGRSVGTLRGIIQKGGERIITSLRDGPVGKLVSRADDVDDDEAAEGDTEVSAQADAWEDDPAETPDDDDPSTVESPEGRRSPLDELSRLADERVRSLVGTAMGHVQQLQAEVRRLHARIEELEERVVKVGRRGRESEPPDQNSS